ncbi:hypothetical protein BJ912DRAFT_968162 [Pholiota molesta]|nr:hypothetical protein BJ912DRAFT_968162 [Pholiota molesta]
MSKTSPELRLSGSSEDILVCIVSYLEPPDILRLGKTCQRLHNFTSTRVVWVHAATSHVISRGFPFPDVDLDNLATPDLIAYTKRGSCLARRWLCGMSSVQSAVDIAAASGISVSDVRFVPGHDALLMTVSKSIWSAVSIWEMDDGIASRRAIFTGFAMNTDERSTATIAISLQLNELYLVEIMHLCQAEDSTYSFKRVYSITTKLKPVTLEGDLLALTDDNEQTVICNWKTGASAILDYSTDDPNNTELNYCTQVVFAHKSILVPIARHTFGWVDGQCVTVCPFLNNSSHPSASWPPLSILMRGENKPTDGCAPMATVSAPFPNPNHSPYLFPPRLTHKVASLRGSLRCKQIALGRFGTALWVQPRDRFATGLLADVPEYLNPPASRRNEALVAAVFPGSLNPVDDVLDELGDSEEEVVVAGRNIFENAPGSSWTSFDYDEVGGRVALGSSFGKVTILQL